MLNFFKKRRKLETCNFCDVTVDKSSSFVLQYKSADGIGKMTVCKECANVFNEIINVRSGVNEEAND